MEKKKILITGGNGFIARNLTEQLGEEYAISAPNRNELNLLDSSKVFDYIKSNRFDAVIHAATYDAAPIHSINDPAKVLENNLKMFFNVAECKDHFGKMIYFGSGAEFSREHWIPKMKEDYFGRHVPADQYGLSKYKMTEYAQKNSNIYNLRLFAVFGKYEDWRVRFISNACAYAVMDLPINIKQNRYYDFMHIDDLVKIVRWFINNNPKQKVYNICTGKTIDFKTIAEKIVKISGNNIEILIKEPGLGKEYSGDNSRLLNELGEYKYIPIDEAIEDMYRWYDSNSEIIERDKLQ